MYNYEMYNLLRLRYLDEILKILVVVVISIFQLFHDKDKVSSVQEACSKCFVVHLLKFEILQTT